MDALHSRQTYRIVPILELVVAAAAVAGLLAIGGGLVRGLRSSPRLLSPVPAARPLLASIPAAVPARAVSIAMLPLLDGKELRVGDTVADVATSLGRAAEVGRQEVDRGTLGERLTRFYDYSGTRFILVFEPFERNGEQRVAAIYLP